MNAPAQTATQAGRASPARKLSNWLGRGGGDISAPTDIESAALRSDRFRLEREGDWRRLEEIVTRMEGGGLKY